MSISRQNLSIIIVSFESEEVIHDCIKSIDKEIKIIVIDNSNNQSFKENIETKYKNVSCILSSQNLGMGSGNNLGIKNTKTDYILILNPDVILEHDTISELILASKKIDTFGLIAPISIDKDYPNFKLFKNKKNQISNDSPFKVKSVDGYAMLFNLKRLNKIENFYFFDENFFMYLENDDLCKRLINLNENIYIIPQSKIKHFGGKAVNEKYKFEVELSRNWHWIWSKFYFNKKHYGFFLAFMKSMPVFLSAIIKYLLYSILRNKNKRKIYFQRISGFVNAFLGKKSHYRPKINN